VATHVPFPAPEQMDDLPSSTTVPRPVPILRLAMGLAVPVLLDLSCIAIACIVAIVLYKLQTPRMTAALHRSGQSFLSSTAWRS
jgi:hypothetical protein